MSGADGGLSFRFVEDSVNDVDVRGIYVSGESYSASSLMLANRAGESGDK